MSGIDLRDLVITDGTGPNARELVRVERLLVTPGECVAVVGESGAGKSLLLRALLGLVPRPLRATATRLDVDGTDLTAASGRDLRRLRGAQIALVSQDALVALDPMRRVGAEVAEPLAIHTDLPRSARRQRAVELLTDVAVDRPALRAEQYPHELSGGMRQRSLIASALAADPPVLALDEPTTALDATVQRRVLELVRSLADDGRAVILISHDIAAVASVADRVVVMRDGRVVESGTTGEVLSAPAHPYTRELLAAARRAAPAHRATGDRVLLEARNVTRRFAKTLAVHDVSLTLHSGEVAGVVGESGSGKSTLIRMLLGAEDPDEGEVTLDGAPWSPLAESQRRARRTRIQLVAQDPRAAFLPTWSIGRTIAEALEAAGVPRAQRPDRVAQLFARVELDPAFAARRPGTLSGGQLQRAAIARALATEPDVLLLDEPLSALDVSVGSRILALLRRLRDEGVAMVLVSHDLAVVGELADRILVMQGGRIVEEGAATEIFARPTHAFTRELLASRAALPPSADDGAS
ncbi:ATP-binding cassette domain-containing protein [Microbacterium sp. ZW T5_56]|uniref:ATP-binding cassette domain-containing protein n=1 Tax=Microbacterium sp. ZW T5_56 TaxID=3378081 RepID=UPI003852CFC0